MPTSRPQTIGPILNLIMQKNPGRVLDVGAGFGKWGLLLREYLEVWQGRLLPSEWRKTIDGLEVFPVYADLPWYEMFYNHVWRMDVRQAHELVAGYDLVLLGDVIEHLPRADGEALLACCKDYVVCTPDYDSTQGPGFGNEAERHVSRWEVGDFPHGTLISGRWVLGWRL